MAEGILIGGLEYDRSDIHEGCLSSILMLFRHPLSGDSLYKGDGLLRDVVRGCKLRAWHAELELAGKMIAEWFNQCVECDLDAVLKDLGFPMLALILGDAATPAAIEALKKGVLMGGDEDTYLFVREHSAQALAQIGGVNIRQYLESVRDGSYPDSPRKIAAWALTMILD